LGSGHEHVLEVSLELVKSSQFTGDELESISSLIANIWFPLEKIPGGTPREINVRAAEFLTVSAKKTGTIYYPVKQPLNFENVQDLISSADWKSRYLGVLLAKDNFAEKSAKLLNTLSTDPYKDEDGFYLVREISGFKFEDTP